MYVLHIHTLAVFIFVVLCLGYIIGSVFVYSRLFASDDKLLDTSKAKAVVRSRYKLTITIIWLISLYLVVRWLIQQLVFGCITIAWWNPTCYNLNELSRAWLAIVFVLGVNALLVGYLYDTKWHPPKYK